MTGPNGISRRQVLTIAAGTAGASIAGATAVIGTSTPAQAAKVSQKIVKYQDTPKGEQRCDNCDLFEAPSSCKNVDGTIAAQEESGIEYTYTVDRIVVGSSLERGFACALMSETGQSRHFDRAPRLPV
jgi:hypothetical protein